VNGTAALRMLRGASLRRLNHGAAGDAIMPR